jgi:acetylxylan esterase
VGASSPLPLPAYIEITDFGRNPTNVRAWLYIPESVVAKPPIVVGMHGCHADANTFYTVTDFKSQADQKGFILLLPQADNSDGCWDAHTNETLT